MQLNLFQNISQGIKKVNISEFIKELTERLKQMEEELVIDRYEGNIVICEDRKTGKIKEIPKEELKEYLKEGSTIKKENGKYVLDVNKQEEIEKRIKQKMDNLWKD